MPIATYGATLLMPAIAYHLPQRAIMYRQGRDSVLKRALGRDLKGKLPPFIYLVSHGDRARVRRAVAVDRALCRRRDHMAGAGPAHRERVARNLTCYAALHYPTRVHNTFTFSAGLRPINAGPFRSVSRRPQAHRGGLP
ncbi:MAG: hypothetical protein P8Z80_09415 [Pseudolabrys sp.]